MYLILKNRPEQIRKKFKTIKKICISSTTYGELCFGIENGDQNLREQRQEQLGDFTQRILIDPWDEEAARHYGSIRAILIKRRQFNWEQQSPYCSPRT